MLSFLRSFNIREGLKFIHQLKHLLWTSTLIKTGKAGESLLLM